MDRAAGKRYQVTRQADKLRAAHKKRLEQSDCGFDDYGNEIFDCEQTEEDIIDDIDVEGVEVIKQNDYYENMLYGIVDGLASGFDENCSNALYGTINGGFRANEYKVLVKPTNTIKFQMSINNFTESANSVYTFCNF